MSGRAPNEKSAAWMLYSVAVDTTGVAVIVAAAGVEPTGLGGAGVPSEALLQATISICVTT
jgi:hypothetical protein